MTETLDFIIFMLMNERNYFQHAFYLWSILAARALDDGNGAEETLFVCVEPEQHRHHDPPAAAAMVTEPS